MEKKGSHKKMRFLSTGSKVEVSSEVKGFNGAWYVAKILKSNYKRKGKFLIKYQTLVSDQDPDELLTEFVDISSIRPLPPPPAADQSYEPLDIVDAFHRDGWWKGIVSKVLEDKTKSRRYEVVFENSPQQLDFSSANLRFHWIYNGGRWVQSPKQKRMEWLKIGKGEAVEVNFDRDNLQDAWFPAIVLEEVGFNSFLVEYSRSGNDCEDGRVKEAVDLFHIRPLPPKLEVQNFEILECVEAFHNSCWKKGTIITTFTQGRYNIIFPSEKEEIQFSQSEIRPHLLWTNGKWVGFREIPDRTQCKEQYADVDDIAKHCEIVVRFRSSSIAQDQSEEKSSCKKRSNAVDYAEEKSSVKKSRNNSLDTLKESNAFGQQDKDEQQHVSEGTASTMGLNFEECVNKEVELSTVTGMENEVLVTDHTTEVGSPCEAVNDDQVPPTCFGSDREGNDEIVQKESNGIGQQDKDELQNVPEGNASEIVSEDCSSKEAELSDMKNGVPFADHTPKLGASCDGDNDDLAQSTCIGSDREGIVETVDQFSAINVQTDSELLKIPELPFTKSSSLWQYVDSVAVFQFLPQNPHFTPLLEHNEAIREGLAIGHMLSFATLVELISKLRVEKSRKVFDSYLEALADLEMLGFDVKAVVDRINNLLSIKTRKEQLGNWSKDIDGKIAECDGEKAKIEEEINTVDKTIGQLIVERAMKLLEKAMKDSESSVLQMGANRINEDISNAKLDFESQVGAPW